MNFHMLSHRDPSRETRVMESMFEQLYKEIFSSSCTLSPTSSMIVLCRAKLYILTVIYLVVRPTAEIIPHVNVPGKQPHIR